MYILIEKFLGRKGLEVEISLGLLEDQVEHETMFSKFFTKDYRYQFSILKKKAKIKPSSNRL